MHIQLSFSNTDACRAFANRFKLSHDGSQTIDAPWHLLHHAKKDTTINTVTQLDTNTTHQFIVKGEENAISALATIEQNLGDGFFLVSTDQGVTLSNAVESIEITSQPVAFLGNVSTITGTNPTNVSLDPTSADAQWARIRIASRYRPLANDFSLHNVTYNSVPEVYVMDSGINFDHSEFNKPNLVTEDFFTLSQFNGDYRDEIGHGTAVASMLVGSNLGVANNCKLINVKIGSRGYTANLFDLGLAIDAIMSRISNDPAKTRVINMSWGIPRSTWLDAKVQSLIDAGVTVVCAAGNDGIDVEDISPAGLDTVITVASVDKYDIPSGFNNISPGDSGLTTNSGLSLDIFAPGEDVIVADAANPTGYKMMSGTSFAAPLVAGVVTEIAALNSIPMFYSELKSTVLDTATEYALLFEDDRFSENQNRLLYLFTSDPNGAYKQENMLSYLGVLKSEGQPGAELIVVNSSSAIEIETYKTVFPDATISYSLEFVDSGVGQEYQSFFSIDSVTGEITIVPPTVVLPEETKLKMIEFIVRATTHNITIESQQIFVFHSNPLYADTLDSDVMLALTDTNSISFYAYWNAIIK